MGEVGQDRREVGGLRLVEVLEPQLDAVGPERQVDEAGHDGQCAEDVERNEDEGPGLVGLTVMGLGVVVVVLVGMRVGVAMGLGVVAAGNSP